MARLEDCVQIGAKLDALYERCGGRKVAGKALENDRHLEERLGIKKSTTSAWRSGDSSKGRPPSRVQPDHLWLLADLLIAVAGDHITREKAHHGWKSLDIVDFRRLIMGQPGGTFERLLETRTPSLKVWVQPAVEGFQWVTKAGKPMDGEVVLRAGQGFQIAVQGHRAQYLVILVEAPNGWQWLIPTEGRTLKLKGSPAFIPEDGEYEISQPPGHHRFVAIEMKSSPPPIPEGANEAFTDERERALVEDLNDYARAGDWRWGECRAFIGKSQR